MFYELADRIWNYGSTDIRLWFHPVFIEGTSTLLKKGFPDCLFIGYKRSEMLSYSFPSCELRKKAAKCLVYIGEEMNMR